MLLHTASQENNLIPTVKHWGGCVMVWGYCAAAGFGQFTIIETTMNSTVHQRVLEEHEIIAEAEPDPATWQWSTTVNPPETDWKPRNGESWNGRVKAQILIPLRCCEVTLNGLYMQETPQTTHGWKNFALRMGQTFLRTMSETDRWPREESHWSYFSQRGCIGCPNLFLN